MTEREKLILELEEKFYAPYKPGAVISNLSIEGVADFILADRKRVVEPLVKWKNSDPYTVTRIPLKAIDETINNAGL